MAAHAGGQTFRDGLLRSGRFSEAELGELFDFTHYLKYVDTILKRIGIDRPVIAGEPRQSPAHTVKT
jgi:hypothetical protein